MYTYPVAASRGGMGVFFPQLGALPPPPLAPRQKKKMAKISHFRQFFLFLPPRYPHKNFSGAATALTGTLTLNTYIYTLSLMGNY